MDREKYKTKDLYEAAYLHSSDIFLIGLKPDTSYFWFVFRDFDGCQKLSQQYWSGKATGNIKDYVNSLKSLKDLLFSQKTSQ